MLKVNAYMNGNSIIKGSEPREREIIEFSFNTQSIGQRCISYTGLSTNNVYESHMLLNLRFFPQRLL